MDNKKSILSFKNKDGTFEPFPMVNAGSYNVTHTTMLDGERNALGDFEGELINDKIKIELAWRKLTPEQWQKIVQLAKNNIIGTFQFWNDETNGFDTKQFYWGDRSAMPHYFETQSGAMRVDFWQECATALLEV